MYLACADCFHWQPHGLRAIVCIQQPLLFDVCSSQKPTPLCIDRALLCAAWASAISSPHMLCGEAKCSKKSNSRIWASDTIINISDIVTKMQKVIDKGSFQRQTQINRATHLYVCFLVDIIETERAQQIQQVHVVQCYKQKAEGNHSFQFLGPNQVRRTTNHIHPRNWRQLSKVRAPKQGHWLNITKQCTTQSNDGTIDIAWDHYNRNR